MQKTSRQRLLDYIRTRKVTSVPEISRALKMTEANARHHLALLQEQGLVEVVGFRPSEGRGRPAKQFRLSHINSGCQLDHLTRALLQEILSLSSEQEISARLTRLAGNLASAQALQIKNLPLPRRLLLAINFLETLHYQARWEAHVESPHIIFNLCPYATILTDYPELCMMDSALLEHLLDLPVIQIARLTRDSAGLLHCVFRISEHK